MENPNTYDDERWSRGHFSLTCAVAEMWEAGASMDDIEDAFEEALEDAMSPPPPPGPRKKRPA